MGGAVRVVAVETAFTDGRVLPQEGAALFAVALITLVVDRVCRNEPLSLRAVRIMAVRANHLLFPQRMMRRLHDRRADLLVAPRAKLDLAGLRQQFRISPVNLMAINAGEFCLIVLAAMPQRHVSPGVTSQTNGIFGGGGQGLGKVHQAANPAAAATAHVIGRRPMATLASLMRRRRFGVAVNAHAIIYVADELIVVAARTQLRPYISGRRSSGRRGWGNNRSLLSSWLRRRRGGGSRRRCGRGVRPRLLIPKTSLAIGV
jgi:hypothetical protein